MRQADLVEGCLKIGLACVLFWTPLAFAGKKKPVRNTCQLAILEAAELAAVWLPPVPLFPMLMLTNNDLHAFKRVANRAVFSREWLEALVESIESSGGEDITSEDIEQLKKMRKSFVLVRTVYAFISHDHEVPKATRKITAEFGRLNDLLNANPPARKRDIKDQAAILITHLVDEIPEVGLDYLAQDLFDYLRKIVSSINQYLVNSKPTVSQFHSLRKQVRDIRNLYKLISKAHSQGAMKENFNAPAIQNYLGVISSDLLGNFNDILFQEFLSQWDGKGSLFEARKKWENRKTFRFPAGLTLRLQTVMELFEAALPQ